MKNAKVYVITCATNKKLYIGVTTKPDAQMRLAEHIAWSGRGSRFKLHSAIRKYGAENFTLDVLESYNSVEDAKVREKFHIAELKTMWNGYNMTAGGDGFEKFVRTPEHAAKISKALTGIKRSEETKAKLRAYSGERASFFGKKQSEEWCENMKRLHASGAIRYPSGAESGRAVGYVVTNPDGQESAIVGIAQFCRANNLQRSQMVSVASGKIDSCKGWECRYADPDKATIAELRRAERKTTAAANNKSGAEKRRLAQVAA